MLSCIHFFKKKLPKPLQEGIVDKAIYPKREYQNSGKRDNEKHHFLSRIDSGMMLIFA